MFNSGPSGFQGAPITKALLILTGVFSVFFSVTLKNSMSLSDFGDIFQRFQLWRLITTHFYFSSPGELLFGVFLLYNFRLFERQMGSVKFGGFTFITWLVSTLAQISSFAIFRNLKNESPGPYGFIFACVVLYLLDVPSTYRFRICGINTTDKLFTYILSLQLLFSNFPSSFLSGVCGIIAGMCYRSSTLRLNRFQFPPVVNNFFSRFILPLLHTPRPPQRTPVAIAPNRVQLNAAFQQAFPQANPLGEQMIPNSGFPANFQNFQTTQMPVRQPPSEETITTLIGMGFSREIVIQALERTNNDVNLATNLLLDGSL